MFAYSSKSESAINNKYVKFRHFSDQILNTRLTEQPIIAYLGMGHVPKVGLQAERELQQPGPLGLHGGQKSVFKHILGTVHIFLLE